jgi:tetratricopeptide (TPR) repeat protein
VLIRQGRRAEAKDLFEKSAWIAERAGRLAVVATCSFHLGNIALSEHRLAEATRLQQAAIDGRRSLGVGGVAAPLSALGAIALADGNYAKAIESFRAAEAEQTSEAAGVDNSYILLGLGRALTGLGDYAAAAPIYKQALSLREGLDDIVGEAIARIAVAESHLDLGQLDAALSEARKALFSLSLVAEVEARADAERVLGKVLLRQRRPEEADARFAEAERILRATDGDRDLLVVLSLRLDAAIASGRAPTVERAMSALEQARSLRPEVPTTPLLELRLWRGAEWLGGHGAAQRDPLQHLRHAYEELLRETGFLAPELRQRFLSQVPDNAAILDAATRAGLSMPVL